jgi:hypothetical protein
VKGLLRRLALGGPPPAELHRKWLDTLRQAPATEPDARPELGTGTMAPERPGPPAGRQPDDARLPLEPPGALQNPPRQASSIGIL